MKLPMESNAVCPTAAAPSQQQPPWHPTLFPRALLTSPGHFPLSVGFE